MAKMLDLTVFQEQFFPIKMLDGSTLYLKKPTQRLLMQFVGFQEVLKASPEEQLAAIQRLTLSILNNNTSRKVFTEADLDDYDISIQQAIIEGYSAFLTEIQSNPN